MSTYQSCPLCFTELSSPLEVLELEDTLVQCQNCGTHTFAFRAMAMLRSRPQTGWWKRNAVAHLIQKIPRGKMITAEMFEALEREARLPSPLESIDLLVAELAGLRVGAAFVLPEKSLTLPAPMVSGAARFVLAHWRARLGCDLLDGVAWAFEQARAEGLIASNGRGALTLSAAGWARFGRLQREGLGSRHAFMAMKFGDDQMGHAFAAMKQAAEQAGFDLRTTADDHQTAGSIDDRMRVEIRTSRFVVCDLTHGNRGAYWEAGFAEGLGRPVFYTCRRDVLRDRAHPDHPHFDTAHQLIIDWAEGETLATDMRRLKNAIRATLPAEARLED